METIKQSGLLLVDKPPYLSSHQVVMQLRKWSGIQQIGHTGTLDPMASGLLPCVIGEATKFSQYLLDADKMYRVQARLGSQTDTGDAEGKVLKEADLSHVTLEGISHVLESMIGVQPQIAPIYSAIKFKGKARYLYARAGIEIPPAVRNIEIKKISEVQWNPPFIQFKLLCSKGTYVRSFVESLGERVGSLAHLSGLRREACGLFNLNRSIQLNIAMQSDFQSAFFSKHLSIPDMLIHLPRLYLSDDQAQRIQFGQLVNISEPTDSNKPIFCCLFKNEHFFLGVGQIQKEGLRAIRLISF